MNFTAKNATELQALSSDDLKAYLLELADALGVEREEIAALEEVDSTEFATPGSVEPDKAIAANQVPRRIFDLRKNYGQPVSDAASEFQNRLGVIKFRDESGPTDYSFIADTITSLKDAVAKL